MQRPQLPGVAVRSRWVAIVALVGVATLVLAAGASSRTRSKDPVSAKGAKISMVLVLDDCVNPVERPLRAGAQAAAKKLKFSLKIVCPSPVTAQAQITLMQTVIASHPKAIVILPV